jgi:hypothetical protein
MGISLQKIHVNPKAPLRDINVAVVVCHERNVAIFVFLSQYKFTPICYTFPYHF